LREQQERGRGINHEQEKDFEEEEENENRKETDPGSREIPPLSDEEIEFDRLWNAVRRSLSDISPSIYDLVYDNCYAPMRLFHDAYLELARDETTAIFFREALLIKLMVVFTSFMNYHCGFVKPPAKNINTVFNDPDFRSKHPERSQQLEQQTESCKKDFDPQQKEKIPCVISRMQLAQYLSACVHWRTPSHLPSHRQHRSSSCSGVFR
jgi:hypothetical protein